MSAVMTDKERRRRTERAEVWAHLNRLVQLAEYEDRELTSEESAEFQALAKRVAKLSAWVKKHGTYEP